MANSNPRRFVLSPKFKGEVKNIFNEISAVASGATVDIVSYTVPAGKSFFLESVEFDGQNVAEFSVEVDGEPIGKRRTHFAGGLSGQSFFGLFEIGEAKTVKLKVENHRPSVANFSGRINGVLDES
jgi:hypothetical protein